MEPFDNIEENEQLKSTIFELRKLLIIGIYLGKMSITQKQKKNQVHNAN